MILFKRYGSKLPEDKTILFFYSQKDVSLTISFIFNLTFTSPTNIESSSFLGAENSFLGVPG